MLDLVVESIQDLTNRIRYFSLARSNSAALPGYSAGAHVEFQTDQLGTRAYSLIDFTPPGDHPQHYHIAVQREDEGNGGSQFMHSLMAGDKLTAAEPSNSFPLIVPQAGNNPSDTKPIVLLAGGIGITPLISMATELRQRQANFHLHYSGRSLAAMAFTRALSDAHAGQVTLYADDIEAQRLKLTSVLGNVTGDQHLYICGPRGMIDTAKALTEEAGLNPEYIHIELFESTTAGVDDSSFEVELHNTGQVFVVPTELSIIQVLEAGGVEVMYDCQRGDCGICQTTVISGEIDHRDVVLSEAEKAAGNVMQICVSRAKSSRLVLDI